MYRGNGNNKNTCDYSNPTPCHYLKHNLLKITSISFKVDLNRFSFYILLIDFVGNFCVSGKTKQKQNLLGRGGFIFGPKRLYGTLKK
jgi:hypothetical protein